ncbi:MAG: ELWxxDGT repeat protein [bacterium]
MTFRRLPETKSMHGNVADTWRCCGLSGLILLALVLSASADTHYVSPSGANISPFTNWANAATTIQAAINAAAAGDAVLVTNGSYNLSSTITITSPINLRSLNGPDNTSVNGLGTYRCFYLNAAGVVLDGFTVSNGYHVLSGAAIYSVQHAEINNCAIRRNVSVVDSGGAVYCQQTAKFSNCTIAANSAGKSGGGVYCAGAGEFFNCTISGNSAGQWGGGVYFVTVTNSVMNNCVVSSNLALFGGGGMYGGTIRNSLIGGNVVSNNSGGGSYNSRIENCTISGNSAGSNGGGTYGGTVENCTIISNRADYGGGVSQAGVRNCTIAGNSAVWGGGGTVGGTVQNCMIARNRAGLSMIMGDGGGAYVGVVENCAIISNSTPFNGGGTYQGTVRNCTISGNSAGRGGGTYAGTNWNSIVYFNTATNSGNNCYSGIVAYACTTPDPGGVGNITSDPLFVNRAAGNYRLSSTSPCIDVGNNAYASGDVDMDGNLRIIGVAVDMGAYEALQEHTGVSPDHYVSPTGGNRWPYTNWVDAATVIQLAIDAASAGDTVLVTNGVYDSGGAVVYGSMTNRVAIGEGVTLRSVNGPLATIIKGNGPVGNSAVRCVYVGSNACLSGFTLTNGFTRSSGDIVREWNGGGVWCESSAVVSNCIITGNRAICGGGVAYGGDIRNCTIFANTAASSGGGTYLARALDCTIAGNTAQDGGGACYGDLIACTVTSNTANRGGGTFQTTIGGSAITGNTAQDGGGAYSGDLNTCTVSGNRATRGGGTFSGTNRNCFISANTAVDSGGGAYQTTIENCTVTRNDAAHGGGTYASPIRNSIVYHNSGTWYYNCYAGSVSFSCTTPDPGGTGNITNEPGLLSVSNPHILSSSPCIDRGTNQSWMAAATDIDGEARIRNGTVDIGCDEFDAAGATGGISVAILADYTNAAAGFALPFVAEIQGRADGFEWQWGDQERSPDQCVAQHAYAAPGDYTVVLTASNQDGSASATVTVHVVGGYTNFVSLGGGHNWPFTSWATAATNIQAAISANGVAGGIVLVSNGVFNSGGVVVSGALTNRIAITNPVVVRSVNGPQVTTIVGAGPKGDSAVRCAYVGKYAGIEGFTLTNGCTRTGGNESRELAGGGIWCESSATVSNCVIIGNSAVAYGGGAYAGTVMNCTIARNTVDYNGAGMFGGAIGDSVITANSSARYGGGAFDVTVDRCLIASNSAATSGGGTYGGKVRNSTLTANSAISTGGGTEGGTVQNCTIVGNSAGSGGGTSGSLMQNCIVYYNFAAVFGSNCLNGLFFHSCASPLVEGPGNIASEPGFVNRQAGDYRLAAGSACIDAGYNAYASGDVDLDGKARIFPTNGVVDIGAYEYAVPGDVRPVLVKDIAFSPDGSAPEEIIQVGGKLFFSASDGDHGWELWVSDGTREGTVMLEDISPGGLDSSPRNLTSVGDMLYFTANDGIHGEELWKSDGTPAGTILVKDINTAGSSSPQNLTDVNGALYFSADDGSRGFELWKSDGTEMGTRLVLDIYPGAPSGWPEELTEVNGLLFFRAANATNGVELWVSGGTETNTALVRDIYPGGGSSYPGYLTAMNGVLYFGATDPENGDELWRSDGTSNGTYMVRNIYPGMGSSYPSYLTAMSNTLYFSANDGLTGHELWKSDGTEGGTVLVADIYPGNGHSYPRDLWVADGVLYFCARDNEHGYELWKSGGFGASMVKDINITGDSDPYGFTELDGWIYFTAYNEVNGWELWKTDGSEVGTVLVEDINSGGGHGLGYNPYIAVLNGELYFGADDGSHGFELWHSDGTHAGTSLLADIRPDHGGAFSGVAGTASLTEVNGMLYFSASNSASGWELWKSDGTEARTVLVKDINPGASNSYPSFLTEMNGILYFSASNSEFGAELWRSDGTVPVKDINSGATSSYPSSLTAVNGKLYFSAYNSSNGTELWKSDGTADGTVLVRDINPGTGNSYPSSLTAMNGKLYFSANNSSNGTELWKSDGTSNGTVLVRDINPGTGNSSPSFLTAVNGLLYFTAATSSNGMELWKSDGTSNGTVLVRDINPGAANSSPSFLTAMNGMLYFSASTGTNGTELWKSDGTSNGTVIVRDIVSGVASSSPTNLTQVNGMLYFSASTSSNGTELWKSDGTSNGTVLVRDINPGATSSSPSSLTAANGGLFFAANDGIHGRELWKSDGTTNGTAMIWDIWPGSNGSAPYAFTEMNGALYFLADEGVHGYELWRYSLAAVAPPVINPSTGDFERATTVTITCPTPGAIVRYTTNGASPDVNAAIVPWDGKIDVNTTNIKAQAFITGCNPSMVVTGVYRFVCAMPVIAPDSYVFEAPTDVFVTNATPGARMYYTTNGVDPTVSSAAVTGRTIHIDRQMVLKVRAFLAGYEDSAIATGLYAMAVAAPVLTPGSGIFTGFKTIAVACSSTGAVIRYTTSNSPPAQSLWVVTNGVILVDHSMTLRAQAFQTGSIPSVIVTGEYAVVVQTPVIDPPGGAFPGATNVLVTCATPGAEIFFTTDGNDPAKDISPRLSSNGLVLADRDMTLKARAFLANCDSSSVAVANYYANPSNVYLKSLIQSPYDANVGHPPIIRSVSSSSNAPAPAVYIPGADRVLCTEPDGVMFVDWWDGLAYRTNHLYMIVPVTNDVTIYHTDGASKAPLIDLRNITSELIIHPNSRIGTNEFWEGEDGQLHAAREIGLAVIHFESAGAYAGAEVVLVKRYQADMNVPVTVGARLLPPAGLTSNGVSPTVTRGKMTGRGDAAGYIYQHSDAGPHNGKVYAVKPTARDSDMEVFWMEEDSHGVIWPYEMRRYTAAWPTNAQRFARRPDSALPKVAMPPALNACKMPAEEFRNPSHYGWLQNQEFWTDGEGYSLLLLESGPAGNRNWVGFDVVRSVYHDDSGVFDLTPTNWIIGTEITNAAHEGFRSGYIYEPAGDRYHPGLYGPRDNLGWATGQIFAVNRGQLEVWWSDVDRPNTNESATIQWPSRVMRYDNVWPTNAARIVIANEQGTGPLSERNWALYYQNDPNQPGFNPNDEHAMIQPAKTGSGQAIFALRNDMGTTNTSEPFVIMTYDDPVDSSRKRMKVYEVEAGAFTYDGTAGQYIRLPYLLALMQKCNESYGVIGSGPFWRDRVSNFWAMAAGNDGGPTSVVMRYFYPMMEGFYLPGGDPQPNIGAPLPWLSGGRKGDPVDVTYTIDWPTNKLPTLQIGETLADTKNDLPQIWGQTSVEVVYQQATELNSSKSSVKLIDPVFAHEANLAALPADVETELKAGQYYFPQLPSHLRRRLSYDPINHKLKFKGELIKPAAGEYYLLLNVITARETNDLAKLSGTDVAFKGAIQTLINNASTALEVTPNTPFAGLALTAGAATGPGYVTVAFNNSKTLNQPADPISLEIIKVVPELYQGEIKQVESDNVFDEKLVLRHSGDFAGLADEYVFEWKRGTAKDDGSAPDAGSTNWQAYLPMPPTGEGVLDITISSENDSPLITLGDNYFQCRYRSLDPAHPCGTNWSEWTEVQLAEGWIKRVLAGINPFEQRFKSFENNQVNKLVSMIAQAGPRCEGNVALNSEAADDRGLIEIYETVLDRGMDMSINAGYNYAPANDALLLAAGRLADLYMLLGNEAYADAADPTIGFGTDDGQYGAEATSLHCFMNQTASLLDEELALLRGRDDSLLPTPSTAPIYNRLIWNFTRDIVGGEVAYVLNYEIQDKCGPDGNPNPDGFITEDDAKLMYPQGHGDAWGHYLTAIQKGYYRLLQNTNFLWEPRIEAVTVGGVPVNVDYLDERKFAAAAAARAQAGAEIVSLTYRDKYVEDPEGQWQGYRDSDTNRCWGLAEWAGRAGQGAFYDWVVANSLLPTNSPSTGIQKVDRTSVLELPEIADAHQEIQMELDKADMGLNPLGLARNVVPFDIDPTQIDQGRTHFEQIYGRAVQAMNNAITVFNHAQNSSQLLRRQADTVQNFQQSVEDREADFKSRLIESFGYPYADDIGPGKTYATGYDGPDIYHFDYTDPSELVGEDADDGEGSVVATNVNFKNVEVKADGALTETIVPVTFHVSQNGFGLVKPYNWTGQRRAPGEIQMAHSDLIQGNARFQRALKEYDNLLNQIEDQAEILAAQYALNADEIRILNEGLNTQIRFDKKIKASRAAQLRFRTIGRMASLIANSLSEYITTSIGLANDPLSFLRGTIQLVGSVITEVFTQVADDESIVELDYQQAQQEAQTVQNIELTSLRSEFAVMQALKQLEQLVRQEATLRLDLFTQQETLNQLSGRYLSALSRGQRLLDERLRFRQQTAARLQDYRYKDMAFRIFRNDALQKYRAQFDLAARYVYLAAKAYDYETNLREGDPRGPGSDFMTQIVRARTVGLIAEGQPQTGGSQGDGGLADPMARMARNWELVLKSLLGFNNPDTETGRFSLRTELLRILPGADGDRRWEETLQRCVVDNLLDMPEFRQYCLPFYPQQAAEPAIVLPFSSGIYFGQNFFGWPAGGGDNTYNSANFATKVRSVGVWFSNYNNIQGGGLINTPHVYLVPVGSDIMRSPTDNTGAIREWKVVDQVLPAPFALSEGELSAPDWIPMNDTLLNFMSIRRIGSFRAYHDSGAFNPAETISNSRLIGRSVWNTRWLLIVPAGSLHSDRDEGLQRFIHGALIPSTGQRDGNGVKDIKVFFQTYSYAGY